MPVLRIDTNVPKDKIPTNFIQDLTGIVAKTLGKPEGYCVIHINPGQMMSFGGDNDNCANCLLMSIGQLGVQENIKHSKVLFEKICKDLNISSKKMYITFSDEKSSDVGHNFTTFFEIFGS